VSECKGTYVSAINFTGEGRIEYCRVLFPKITKEREHGYFQGILPAGSSNCVVTENLVENGISGIYGDTGSEVNLRITKNRFYNVCLGIAIVKSDTQQDVVDGLLFEGNEILLSTELVDYERGGIKIVNTGPQFYRNLELIGNRIAWFTPESPTRPSNAFAVCVWAETPTGENLYNVRIADNTVERSLDWRFKCKDLVLDNNRDLEGKLIEPRFVSLRAGRN